MERTSQATVEPDPFAFRGALKADGELSDLRKRRRGKRLVNYHRTQNTVRRHISPIHIDAPS